MRLIPFFKLIVLFLLLPVLALTFAKGDGNSSGNSLRKTTGSPSTAKFNINNISTFIYNDGTADVNGSNPGYYFPALGGNTACFQSGFLFGGYVGAVSDTQLRIGGSVYRTSLTPGRIISPGSPANPNGSDVRIYRVRPDYLTGSVSKEIQDEGKSEQSIRDQYALDWAQWPANQGAPFVDINKDGIYEPDIDIPGVLGADQTIWFVANDLNSNQTVTFYHSLPMGVEVQCTVWGYNQNGALDNMLFKKYTLINKNQDHKDFNQFYVSYFTDVDIGGGSYDYAGCDTTRSLFYTFSGITNNAEYGTTPPATGVDFMQGPVIHTGIATDKAIFKGKYITGYKNLPMTSDYYFINCNGCLYADPDQNAAIGITEWYNLFQGKIASTGTPFTDPTTNLPSKFPLYGDPVANTGWLDNILNPPGDRRNGGVSGPFTLAYGDTQEVVIAEMSAGDIQGIDNLGAVTALKNEDDIAQNAYNNFFQIAKPAPAPKLQISELNHKLLLDWGYDQNSVNATESYTNSLQSTMYTFQGYNVYQLPSASAGFSQAKKLATFDIVDGVKTITDLVPDPSSGLLVPVVVANGTDSGISRSMLDTIDIFTNKKFLNGFKYYFAVTSYTYNPSPPFGSKVIENLLTIITAIPQTINSGITVHSNIGDNVPVQHTSGISAGSVSVQVIGPLAITGHDYQISFDAIDGRNLWKVTDVKRNIVEISGQTQNQFDSSPIIDGLQVNVADPPVINNWTFIPAADNWLSGVDGSIYNDLYPGQNFFGSNLNPDNFRKVEVRFSPTATGQKAYRWLQGGTPNYGYQDYTLQYFTVWDVTSVPNVQLSAAYVTQQGTAVEKLPWQPTSTTSVDREYLFILGTPYSDTPNPIYTDPTKSYNADTQPSLPVMYALWPALAAGKTFNPQTGQIFTITPNRINTTSDIFTFSTSGMKADTILSRVELNSAKINYELSQNYPNPFNPTTVINYSIEKSGFVSIKVYNVLGQEVATLVNGNKLVGNYRVNFDAAKHGLASGIYMYAIRTNGFNVTKKMVLVK